MQKVFIAVFALIAILAVCFYFRTSYKKTHFHSGFQVYTNGELQDYTDAKFMSLVPCTDDGHPVETEDKVHLHDSVGNIVHVHKSNVIWKDLFEYIKLDLNGETVKGFINGQEVNNIGEVEIQPYDSLTLLIGEYSDVKPFLDKALTKEYIVDAETKSGLCAG